MNAEALTQEILAEHASRAMRCILPPKETGMITNPVTAYDCYMRPKGDVYGTLMWDECSRCGGLTFGPNRHAMTSEQIAQTGAERRSAVPEPCRCKGVAS